MKPRIRHLPVYLVVTQIAVLAGCNREGDAMSGNDRMRDINNLKQMALAIHVEHDNTGQLPSAIFDKEGKPLLSWRVTLLPYLEQQTLYNQFRLNEPWDSVHNQSLIARMPRIYLTPGISQEGETVTHYRLFQSDPEQTIRSPFYKRVSSIGRRGMTMAEIFDGTSNTLMIVQTDEAVTWTRPDDLEFDQNKPLPKLASFTRKGCNVAIVDGSVRWLPSTLPESTFRAMISANGGEIINPSDFEDEDDRKGGFSPFK